VGEKGGGGDKNGGDRSIAKSPLKKKSTLTLLEKGGHRRVSKKVTRGWEVMVGTSSPGEGSEHNNFGLRNRGLRGDGS